MTFFCPTAQKEEHNAHTKHHQEHLEKLENEYTQAASAVATHTKSIGNCYTATYCNTLCNMPQCTATRCNALQRTTPHCYALQRAATRCNALQRTATHCCALQNRRIATGIKSIGTIGLVVTRTRARTHSHPFKPKYVHSTKLIKR